MLRQDSGVRWTVVLLAAFLIHNSPFATSDKASDMNPGTEFSFTGKVEGARYDATAMMVMVLVDEAAIQ